MCGAGGTLILSGIWEEDQVEKVKKRYGDGGGGYSMGMYDLEVTYGEGGWACLQMSRAGKGLLKLYQQVLDGKFRPDPAWDDWDGPSGNNWAGPAPGKGPMPKR